MISLTGGFKKFALFLLVATGVAVAQTTTVTGPLIDPSGNVWTNAVVTAVFVPAPNSPGPYHWSGGSFNTTPPSVITDGSGNFTLVLPTNQLGSIVPSGSSWQINAGPNATTAAAVANISLGGGTLNLTTAYTAAGGWPTMRINPTSLATVYNVNQTLPPPTGQGGMVFNTTTQQMEVYTNTGWQSVGAGGGFPFTLGSTPIAAGSSTPAVTGLSVNGVTLQTGGSTGAFLNQAGGYSSPSGLSVKIKYLSVEGCPQNTDPNAGGGTDATACINALLAPATERSPIIVVQDGFSLIGSTPGVGINGPKNGNWAILGNGGGISRINITNCSISGGVATLTTAANTLVAGETGTFGGLTHCPSLTNTTATVSAIGLTSTQFQVAAGGTVAAGAETGQFNRVYGTGFYLANSANIDGIANGNYSSSGGCQANYGGTPSAQGANILLRDFVLNGNANGQSNYCYGIHISDINGLTIDNVTFYNASHFSLTLDNTSEVVVHGSKFFSSSNPVGTNVDGIHVDGPASDLAFSDNYFRTGDDAIAINSPEGYCGPITRLTISNNTFEKVANVLRMYNENINVCSNGLVPLISYVDMNNNNGTANGGLFLFGLGGPPYEAGTLNPAISHVHISNSTFNGPLLGAPTSGVTPFRFAENFDDITVSNFTLDSPTTQSLFQFGPGTCNTAIGTGHFNHLSVTDFNVSNTASGSAFQNLWTEAGCVHVGTVKVNGFSTTWNGATPVAQGPLFPILVPGASMDQLLASNVDPSNLEIFPYGSNWNAWGIANIFAMIPNGIVTSTVVGAAPLPTSNYSDSGLPVFAAPTFTFTACNFNGQITGYIFACQPTYWAGHSIYLPVAYPNP